MIALLFLVAFTSKSNDFNLLSLEKSSTKIKISSHQISEELKKFPAHVSLGKIESLSEILYKETLLIKKRHLIFKTIE
jgi:hypothetical protein